MSRRLAIFLVCALIVSLFPSSALAVRVPLAERATAAQQTTFQATSQVPAALARANVPAATWQRIVEQICADQALSGCSECAATLADYTQANKLLAADGAAYDRFGASVALWNDTLVVGAWGDETYQGAAYVFQRNSGGADAWGQVTKLTASDGVGLDYFGSAVGIWGDTIVVGAHGNESTPGAAYVFARNTGSADNWGQVTKLTASNGAADDYFGDCLAIWGDTVVVGAQNADVTTNTDQGSAYVFARNYDPSNPGTPLADNWGEVEILTAGDGAAYDRFGCAVAIAVDRILVGASGDESGRGAAYVFARNQGGPDNWGQTNKLTASDGASGDNFGWSVGLWADTAVVAAPFDRVGSNSGQGSAYVFVRNANGADNWGQVKKLTAADGAVGDLFGYSVDIHGDTVIIGAQGDDQERGSAYVFARNEDGADEWGQAQKLTASDRAAYDYFGVAVTLWGDTVVVGAHGDDVSAFTDQGSAYIFTEPCTPDRQFKKKTANDGTESDAFGFSAAIHGDTLVVGAYGAEVGEHIGQGAAYVFARNSGGPDNWGQMAKLNASDGAANDVFGFSVAIWGDTIVVGAAWAEIDDTIGQGAAYVFARNYDPSNPGTPLADNWGEVKKLIASDGAERDYFGSSVGICADMVVVGAYRAQVGSNAQQGAAYLFARNYDPSNPGTPLAENWGQFKKLTASDGAQGDWFGDSVAIWGDTVVAGAQWATVGTTDYQGAAYVFARNYDPSNPGTPLADNWGEVKKLTASDGAERDYFGQAVAIWGDTVVVGADFADVDTANQGAAYVFARNYDPADPGTPLADNWGQVAKLTASDGAGSNYFGRAVDVCGDTVVVGAESYVVGGNTQQGAAYLFERNSGGVDNWGQVAKLTASDGAEYDWFAFSVGIWGDTVVAGAAHDQVGDNLNQGSAYLFDCAGAPADLMVSKASEPQVVLPQGTLTYTLSFSNTLPNPAAEVYVSDTLPAGVAFDAVVSAPEGWTGPNVVGQSVGWYTPTLGGGISGEFVFTALANLGVAIHPDWVLTNTAEITCTSDLTPTNNHATASTVLQGLALTKSHHPDPVTATWNFWYDIWVTNTATTAATNVVIEDTLPVEVPAYSVIPSPGGVFDGINKVTWTIPSLGPNSSQQVWLRARTYSTAAGKCMVNVALADSDQAAPRVGMKEIACVVAPPPPPQPTPTPTLGPGGPVIIQQGTFGYAEDTHVYRYAPDKNYFLAPQLKVGYKQNYAALLRFDLSPVPAGSTIDSAVLQVYAEGWGGSDLPIGAYAVLRDVQLVQTTWNVAETGGNWEAGGANAASDRRLVPESSLLTHGPKQWYSFDITSLVQEWVNGTLANNGVLLRPENNYPPEFYFTSAEGGTVGWRPKLVVRYH